jgi:predicted DNA-binding protein
MGRPPLGVKFTAIRLPPEMLERIDALAGKGRRSEFIREAVQEKLDRLGK